MKWFGGVEAGGTKFNCIVASDPQNILAETRISTTIPEETLPQVINFFKQVETKNQIKLSSLGLGFFGPLGLNPSEADFGYITSTPKLAWRNAAILPYFSEKLNLPVAFDTDVTAAALGEREWGAAQGCTDFIYLTIGTGIGGGIICAGKPVHGLVHPEVGHMFIPHDLKIDPFLGSCPSHHDCLEGLASGPAICARWGQAAETLTADHPAWTLEATYLGYALANLVLSYSPQRIILGGGVMKITGLIEQARKKMVASLNGYVQNDEILEHSDTYIQAPGLGDRAGVLGAVALAKLID